MSSTVRQKLSSALVQTDISLLREAIAEGADLNAPILSGAPPLVVLAESLVCGYPEELPLFHELVAKGANVNQADERGNTALHWAAGANDVELVRYLLAHGADPLSIDSSGRSPLAQTDPGVARTLLENASGTQFVPHARISMKM